MVQSFLTPDFIKFYHDPNSVITVELQHIVESHMSAELHTVPESIFWYWIQERHNIFLKRQRGEPKPWTQDPILQNYKFTNPFRENDRGTVWLREHFLEPYRDDLLELIAFNICWYRMFNFWGTGALLGWQTSWPVESIKERLRVELRNQRQVFTGAHIVYSPPGYPKIDAIVEVCNELWKRREEIVSVARKTRSLQLTFDTLTLVHCVGGFMGYEMVTDMRHTRLLEDAHDINTWANVGPGAVRGLRRLGMPATPQHAALESMQLLLSRSQERPNALPEWVPELELRDIEHSLCETDKYCRVKFGEGEPRSRYSGV